MSCPPRPAASVSLGRERGVNRGGETFNFRSSEMKAVNSRASTVGRNPFIHELKFTMTEKIKPPWDAPIISWSLSRGGEGVFHWIKVKGERAKPSEVPILTMAPHSSYFDAIPVTMNISDQLHQAGVCVSLGSSLQKKDCAFIPGLPVQPVVLRYPNKLYLPIYTPSKEERENPALFASNVRKLMAKALELPLIDLSFDDREISLSHGPLSIHDDSSLLQFHQLVCCLERTDSLLQDQVQRARDLQGERVNLQEVSTFLNLSITHTLTEVHSLFDQHGDGLIDIRLFVIALSTVHRPSQAMETLKLAFKMFESEDNGYVLEEDLAAILEIMLGVRELDLSAELHHFIEQHPHFVKIDRLSPGFDERKATEKVWKLGERDRDGGERD
ncbi:hypothetical protein F7725_024723 [Dissostichus mawsoni]|uniref:Lysophosphatidylcholine acyltransferase 1 n=1 Tax=Dissostichus mawsoni TaxID=36200 RepID=A0A7J5XA23_DISMA|nr:hypothetical protein F7725_024723 [Dissostichus mawsoni]